MKSFKQFTEAWSKEKSDAKKERDKNRPNKIGPRVTKTRAATPKGIKPRGSSVDMNHGFTSGLYN
jgi:hypothetical protein